MLNNEQKNTKSGTCNLSLPRMSRTFVFLLCYICCLAQAGAYQLFEENGKTGLKDEAGNILIPARFEALGWSNGSFSVVQFATGYKLNNKWGLISINNRILTPAEFVELLPTETELIAAARLNSVTLKLTHGCLNPAGKTIIPFVYAGIRIHARRVITCVANPQNQLRYGITDLRHRPLLPVNYTRINYLGKLRFAVQNTMGKTALFTENGTALTGFVFDSIASFISEKAVVYANGRQGLINSQGETIIPPVYRELKLIEHTWMGRLPRAWYLLTARHTITQQFEADTLVVGANEVIALLNAGTVTLLDNDQKKEVSKLVVDAITPIPETDLLLVRCNQRQGVIRTDGKLILPLHFSRIIPAHGVWITEAQSNASSRWQLFSPDGKALSGLYEYMESLSPTFIRVRKNGFEGMLHASGAEALPCVYDRILEYRHGLVAVQFRQQYGVVTPDDRWVVAPRPRPLQLVSANTYLEEQDGLLWLRHLNGTVLYFTRNLLTPQGDYLVEETTAGARWLISHEGRIVHREWPATQPADWTGPASEGFRPVRRNGRYGFINDAGLLLIPNRYEEVMPFSEGRAGIKIRNKWGFIDYTDRIVIQPVYDKAEPFYNGTARVSQKNKWGLIDKEGNLLVPVRYDSLSLLPSGRVLVQADGHYGLVDTQGNQLLHPKYEQLNDLNNGMVIVKQNGKYGVTDIHGVALIPLSYDYLFYHAASGQFIGTQNSSWEKLL
jgi:hypothetical protein